MSPLGDNLGPMIPLTDIMTSGIFFFCFRRLTPLPVSHSLPHGQGAAEALFRYDATAGPVERGEHPDCERLDTRGHSHGGRLDAPVGRGRAREAWTRTAWTRTAAEQVGALSVYLASVPGFLPL